MARTTIVVGTGSAGGVSRRQQAKAGQATDARADRNPADMIAQLKELAALKEQGVLTEEEFTAQKARILGA